MNNLFKSASSMSAFSVMPTAIGVVSTAANQPVFDSSLSNQSNIAETRPLNTGAGIQTEFTD